MRYSIAKQKSGSIYDSIYGNTSGSINPKRQDEFQVHFSNSLTYSIKLKFVEEKIS